MKNNRIARISSNMLIITIEQKISSLNTLYENTNSYLEAEKNNFSKEIDDTFEDFSPDEISEISQEVGENYSFLLYNSTELKKIQSHFILVAMYSFYEKAIKNLIMLLEEFSSKKLNKEDIKECYKSENLENLLKNKFLIEVKSLDDYNKINELRCINNCIKHDGIVDNKLQGVNGKWKIDEEFDDLYSDFIRLKDAPFNFLQDLRQRIISKI